MADFKSRAASNREKLRLALRTRREVMQAENRSFPTLDKAFLAGWVVEEFLRELGASPLGRSFVLKGGNLFKLEDPLSARPTIDLDMQRVDGPVGTDRFIEDVRSVVESESFRARTGIWIEVDSLKLTEIKKAFLGEALRFEGPVHVGPPDGPFATTTFCLEITQGPAPKGAVRVAEFPATLPKEDPFPVLASSLEWCAAEKTHAICWHGKDNTRLKDVFDLASILGRPAFDAELFRECVHHVFIEEFKGNPQPPRRADDVPGLCPDFADAERERIWRRARWPEWTGRLHDEASDPSLSEAVAAVACGLERHGLIEAPHEALAARALADLRAAATDIETEGLDDTSAVRFGAAFAELMRLSEDAALGFVGWRHGGECVLRQTPRTTPNEAFEAAFAVADAFGLTRMLTKTLRAKTGADAAAEFDRLRGLLSRANAPASAVGTSETVTPAKTAPTVSSDELRATLTAGLEGLVLGAEKHDLNRWMSSLTKVVCALRDGAVSDGGLEIPDPPVKVAQAAKIWASIAKKQGLDGDLETVLSGLRERLLPATPAL